MGIRRGAFPIKNQNNLKIKWHQKLAEKSKGIIIHHRCV